MSFDVPNMFFTWSLLHLTSFKPLIMSVKRKHTSVRRTDH